MKPSNLLPKKSWLETRDMGSLASLVWWNWFVQRSRPDLASVKSTDHRRAKTVSGYPENVMVAKAGGLRTELKLTHCRWTVEAAEPKKKAKRTPVSELAKL